MLDKAKILSNINVMETISSMPRVFIECFVKISRYYQAFSSLETITNQDRTDFINETYNSMNLLSKLLATASNGEPLEAQVRVPEPIKNPFPKAQAPSPAAQEKVPSVIMDTKKNTMEFRSTIITGKAQIPVEVIPDNIHTEDDTSITEAPKAKSNQNQIRNPNESIKPLTDNIPKSSSSSEKSTSSLQINTEKDSEIDMARKKTHNTTAKKITPRQTLINNMEKWGIEKDSFTYEAMLTLLKVGKKSATALENIRKIADILGKSTPTVASAFSFAAKRGGFASKEYMINTLLTKE